jgi:hypothetical protein
VGNYHQVGDATLADESSELSRQAACCCCIPHELIEIAIDHYIVGLVDQPLTHGIDESRFPIIIQCIGLLARTMNERDTCS